MDELIRKSLYEPPRYMHVRINNTALGKNVTEAKDDLKRLLQESYKSRGWETQIELGPGLFEDMIPIEISGPFDQIPLEEYVVVDALCGNAVMKGADIFATGLLCVTSKVAFGCQVSVYCDLEGTCLRGSTEFNGRKLFLGNGIFEVHDKKGMFRSKATDVVGIGVVMTQPIYKCPSLNHIVLHGFTIQSLPCYFASLVLNPQPNERILDMCCAPGGKTTHLAELSKNNSFIIALDRSSNKIKKLKQYVERHNYAIYPFCIDSTSCVMSQKESALSGNDDNNKLLEIALRRQMFPRCMFDKILLDGPCSGLGQRPLLKMRVDEKDVRKHQRLQRSLLHAAHALLKPDGLMVYSTCTITLQENEENVIWALQQFSTLELVEPTPDIIKKMRLAGAVPGINYLDEPSMKSLFIKMYRFNPNPRGSKSHSPHFDQDIGFFIAIFRKKASVIH